MINLVVMLEPLYEFKLMFFIQEIFVLFAKCWEIHYRTIGLDFDDIRKLSLILVNLTMLAILPTADFQNMNWMNFMICTELFMVVWPSGLRRWF